MQPLDQDLSGKTCIVTGANTGIGKQVARELARMGASVTLACRSRERGEAARAELAAATGSAALEVRELDLARPASIAAFAERFARERGRLDVLVNNAGVWLPSRQIDERGLELTFATNALGYFRLTNALEDLLLRSAPARVVDVASKLAGGLDLSDLSFVRRGFSGTRAYAQSKQANRMLAWERAERLRGSGVTVNALHPGGVNTEIARSAPGILGGLVRAYFRRFTRSVEQGADTAVWLAASPELAGVTGRFWQDRRAERCQFKDFIACRALWERCEELSA